MRGKDFVRRLLGRKTKKRAGIAVIPFRAGIAVGAKVYAEDLAEMEGFTGSVDVGVVLPSEESGDENYASCYDSDDEEGE